MYNFVVNKTSLIVPKTKNLKLFCGEEREIQRHDDDAQFCTYGVVNINYIFFPLLLVIMSTTKETTTTSQKRI